MVGAYLGLASAITIAILTGTSLVVGLQRGTIYFRRVGYSRAADPGEFWFITACYALGFLSTTGMLAYIAADILIGR